MRLSCGGRRARHRKARRTQRLANGEAPAPGTTSKTAIRAKALSAGASEAIAPEEFEPKDDQGGRAEGGGDDDPKRREGLSLVH